MTQTKQVMAQPQKANENVLFAQLKRITSSFPENKGMMSKAKIEKEIGSIKDFLLNFSSYKKLQEFIERFPEFASLRGECKKVFKDGKVNEKSYITWLSSTTAKERLLIECVFNKYFSNTLKKPIVKAVVKGITAKALKTSAAKARDEGTLDEYRKVIKYHDSMVNKFIKGNRLMRNNAITDYVGISLEDYSDNKAGTYQESESQILSYMTVATDKEVFRRMKFLASFSFKLMETRGAFHEKAKVKAMMNQREKRLRSYDWSLEPVKDSLLRLAYDIERYEPSVPIGARLRILNKMFKQKKNRTLLNKMELNTIKDVELKKFIFDYEGKILLEKQAMRDV